MTLENFQKTVLSNGIRVISEYIDTVHSVSLGFWVLSGSQNEIAETNGIAHLFEHLAFKRTINRDAFQIAHAIESLGGVINAYTSKNLTCYYVRLMSEHLETGVDVLSDLILHPAFTEAELEREKGVIIEEIREIEDTPSEVIHDYFIEVIYPDHALGRPIQGTVNSVQSISSTQVLDFLQKNYTADRLIIAAAGRVKHETLVRLVQQYLAEISPKVQSVTIPRLQPIQVFHRVIQKPISQSHVILGRRIFPYEDQRRYQLSLLNVILSGGMSSRLFQNIREKYGFVYAIYSFSDFYTDDGLFGIYAGVESNRIDTIKDLIYHELKQLAKDSVPAVELEKVKQQFKGGLVLSLEGMHSRMTRLAKMEIFEHRILTIAEFLQLIEEIKADELWQLAQYLIQDQNWVETIIKPQSLES
jgi:predicted Zn-dependent peptidase